MRGSFRHYQLFLSFPEIKPVPAALVPGWVSLSLLPWSLGGCPHLGDSVCAGLTCVQEREAVQSSRHNSAARPAGIVSLL